MTTKARKCPEMFHKGALPGRSCYAIKGYNVSKRDTVRARERERKTDRKKKIEGEERETQRERERSGQIGRNGKVHGY